MYTCSMLSPGFALLLVLGSTSGTLAASTDAQGDALPPRATIRIGSTRFRHGDTVTAAAFAPDGRTVATASRDGTVSLWESTSGRESIRYRGHKGAVLAVAFSSDGERLISGGVDGTVRLWSLSQTARSEVISTGAEIRCRRLLRGEAQAFALAADGSMAAAGTAEGEVVLYDLKKDKVLRHLQQEGQVFSLALSADGKQLATNRGASGIVLWNAFEGERRHYLGGGLPLSLAFSADGRTLAAGYQTNRLVLWDTQRGTEIRALAGHERAQPGQPQGIFSICFSADGRQVASGGTDNTVRIWDATSGRQTSAAVGHRDNVTALAVSADGKRLLSGSDDNTVRLWDAATGRSLLPQREPDLPLTGVSLDPEGRTLAITNHPNHLTLWDATNGRELALPAAFANGLASAAVFCPLGRTLAVAGADDRLHFWNMAERTVRTAERESPRRLQRLVWSRDGKTLASSGPDHHIDLWEPNKGELLQRMGLQEEAYLALTFDRRNERMAAASEVDAIRLWDRNTGLEKKTILGHFPGALALSFSTDGRSLCAAGSDGQIRLWELATNRVRYRFTNATEITAAAFTPNGRFLATGDSAGVVRLWDAAGGKERGVLRGHRGPIAMLAFAARAPLLASASRDTTAVVWHVADLFPIETPSPLTLSERDIETLWTKLAAEAPSAYEALGTLRRAEGQVVPSLRGRLQPVKIDAARLIADLDSDSFPVRDRASQELARFGRFVEKPLRQTLTMRPSLEVRHRIELLLDRMRDAPDTVRATPREIRCIELLESIGNVEARRLLQVLAGGIAEAEMTCEAKASLGRLARRSAP